MKSIIFALLAFLTSQGYGQICTLSVPHCGVAMSPRVLNGETATFEEFPWTVSIQKDSYPICTGALIHPNWVLTAAHCFQSASGSSVVTVAPSSLSIVVGATDLKVATQGKRFSVLNVINHPQYYNYSSSPPQPSWPYDIALLKVQTVDGVNGFRTICLPKSNGYDEVVKTPGKFAGYGKTENGDEKILKKANGQIYFECSEPDQSTNRFCLNTTQNAANANSGPGDSGSPLVVYSSTEGRYYQYGVVTTTQKVFLPQWDQPYSFFGKNLPGGVRVNKFLDWIHQQIKTYDPSVCAGSTGTTSPLAPIGYSGNLTLIATVEGKSLYSHNTWGNKSWIEAMEICRTQGMYGASIESAAQELAVENWQNTNNGNGINMFWLGGTKLFGDQTWRWHRSGKEFTYSNWLYGSSPTAAPFTNMNCLKKAQTKKWWQTNCIPQSSGNSAIYALCEYP